MKENDIRPADLRKKCENLFKKDAKDLLVYSKDFVEVDCPACGTKNREDAFNKEGYIFKKCIKCRTYYISPRPTQEILKKYYSASRASKFWQDYIFPQSKDARIKGIYKPRVDRILDIVSKNNTGRDVLVDVGAGSGFFGEEVASRGFFKKIMLIEPGPIRIKNTDRIEIINDVIENVSLSLNPDVVTNFELIEHLFSPIDFLRTVYRLMKDDSCFIFTTPNIEGFELLTLFDKSINVAGPDHLNYFNIDSIKSLVERAGFKDIRVLTTGELDVDIVVNKHNEGVIDLRKHPFLYHILVENGDRHREIFQEFLKKNSLSANMLIICKK
ncbi:class I SAM-dependent methyltransferase [Candidatus Omnitrophota bacterium]